MSSRTGVAGGVLLGALAGLLASSLDDGARALVAGAPFAAAAAIDVRTRRIPNALSACALTLGVAAALVDRAAIEALGGASVALIAGTAFAIAARGAFGMGDVKLMAGAGAVAGLAHVIAFLLAMALAGGLLAVIMLARRRGLRGTMPYAPAIALGVADVLLIAGGA